MQVVAPAWQAGADAANVDTTSGDHPVTNADKLDEVAAAMRSIVTSASERDSAAGYFAAMYLGVTDVVRARLVAGAFATPDRLVDLTTVFARRYLDAWERFERDAADDRPSASWQVAFDAGERWRPTVLQHLLLGMNAHINLDLGIASAHVAPGPAITGLRQDFDEINRVLASHVAAIQGQLNRISPLYRFVDEVSGAVDRAVINFSIARARGEAWKLATFLATAEPAAAAARIAEHDRIVAAIGHAIVHPGPYSSTGLLAVRLTERRSPRAIIDVLTPAPT